MEPKQVRLRWSTRLRLSVLLLRELLRAFLSPLRLLISMPVAKRHRRSFVEIVAQSRDRDPSEGTEHARAFFRAQRDARPVQRILLSCGEASGERHAIKLLEELKSSPVEVHAFGGLRLAEMPGVQLHINLVDRAVMGITGALAELPFFMRAVGRWMEMLDEIQPDAVVLVDNPGLHMLLAEQARKRDIPVLYYICPQYWAWASWRMDRFAKTVDAAMAILPFEPPLFADAGIPTGFAGHPMLHEEHPPRPLAEREDLLLLLPGSRSKELERHTEGMLRIAIQVRRRHPQLRVVIPQSSPKHAARLRTRLEEHEGADFVEIIEEEPREWLPRARVALVKSGTSTMETAIAGTPMVICYHLTSLSEQIMLRWIVNTPWIGAPNLVLAEEIVPEHTFRDEAAWSDVEHSLLQLIENENQREAQSAALLRVRDRLSGPGAASELRRWLLD
jgi:lipid-A-disaccharide synthase